MGVNLESSSSRSGHRHRCLSSHIYRVGRPIRAGTGAGDSGAPKGCQSPRSPEVRTRLPRWARDPSQHSGAGTSRLSWKVRSAFASRGCEESRRPRVGSKKPPWVESGGAVNQSTLICQGEELEAQNTLNPEAEIPANRK